MPRHLGRTFLALAAALLSSACLGGGDGAGDSEDATPSPTPTDTVTGTASPMTATPTATATSTATPRPTATPPAGGIPPIVIAPSDALTVREFAPGEALDSEFGLFIADATTGVGELWAIREEPDPLQFGPFYSSSPDGRFVRARVRDTEHIVDLDTRSGFQWNERDFRMIGFPDPEGRVLFRSGGAGCALWAVEFRAAEAALFAVIALGEEADECGDVDGLFAPGGTALFISAQVRDGALPSTAALYVLDLADGALMRVGELEATLTTQLHALPRGQGVLVVGRSGGKSAEPAIEVARYGWDGTPLGERTIAIGGDALTSSTVFPSPDGRMIAWQEHLPLGIPFGLGGNEHWPVVALADLASGEVTVRLLRASMSNGTGFTGWLADNSLLVATAEGYAVFRPSDGRLTTLGFGTVAHFEPRPIAAPGDAGLFAFDGRVVDRRGELVRPIAPAAEAWSDNWGVFTNYDWGASSELLRFSSIPPFGRDFGPGGLSMPNLEARVQSPPFPDELRLRVSGTVTHLNLRAEPLVDSDLVAEIPEGEAVVVVDAVGEAAGPCGSSEGCSVTFDTLSPGERWWLHVRTATGLEGWAASDFLDWAESPMATP